MKVTFVIYHPCYCDGSVFLKIDVTGIEVIPRKGEIVYVSEFLPETATGEIAEMIRGDGSSTFDQTIVVDQVVHHKGEIIVEF